MCVGPIAFFQLTPRQPSPTRRGSVCHTPYCTNLLPPPSPLCPLQKRIDGTHHLHHDVPTLHDTPSFFTLQFCLHFASVTVYLLYVYQLSCLLISHNLSLIHADVKMMTMTISMTMASLVNELATPNMSTSKFPTAQALSRANSSGPPCPQSTSSDGYPSYLPRGSALRSRFDPSLARDSNCARLRRWYRSRRSSRRGQTVLQGHRIMPAKSVALPFVT